ncbi:hypothetical protein Tcan_03454 [Toxocara canis]|uniref:Uncharacterized protein n=1 Tax=Toxocara canis TaxID=6265 RepID=A0A0B2VDQ1_TOXCA|nr:hypothetical protein Tcan_03454 [Toxocara canis]
MPTIIDTQMQSQRCYKRKAITHKRSDSKPINRKILETIPRNERVTWGLQLESTQEGTSPVRGHISSNEKWASACVSRCVKPRNERVTWGLQLESTQEGTPALNTHVSCAWSYIK